MTVTVSIVSHGHHSLLPPLLSDIADCPEVEHLILTLNRPEPIPTLPQPLAHRTTLILNSTPKGFGANHNAAFAHCRTPYFAILNPDLRLPHNPFPTLLATLANSGAAIASPSILNPSGAIEDHARHFPTVKSLLRKLFRQSDDRYRYTFHTPPFPPQWLAGIFLLVRHDAFAALNGFDERYYLYYEDVDLCIRAWHQGLSLLVCPQAQVIHAARRMSHRHPRYLFWHLKSLVRYLLQHSRRLPHFPQPLSHSSTALP